MGKRCFSSSPPHLSTPYLARWGELGHQTVRCAQIGRTTLNILAWLDEAALWSKLRSMGSSRLVRSTAIIPIVGYFIIFNDSLIAYIQSNTNFCGDCSVSWRISCLYFGLCFLTIGSILFTTGCPDTIKRFAKASDFFNETHLYYTTPSTLSTIIAEIERMQGAPL